MKPIYNLITLLMGWLSVEVGVDEGGSELWK